MKKNNNLTSANAELASHEEVIAGKNMSAVEQKRTNHECQTSPYVEQPHLQSEKKKDNDAFLSYVALRNRTFNNFKLYTEEGSSFFNISMDGKKYIKFWAEEGINIEWYSGIDWASYNTHHYMGCKMEFNCALGWATLSAVSTKTGELNLICMLSSIGDGKKLLGFTKDDSLAYVPEQEITTSAF